MSTILEFPRNPCRANTRDPFRWHIPPLLVGYALVLALVLASLVFGPPTMLAGEAELGCLPAPPYTD
jgi:hypothetical protein